MTQKELLAKYPNASADFIRRNADEFVQDQPDLMRNQVTSKLAGTSRVCVDSPERTGGSGYVPPSQDGRTMEAAMNLVIYVTPCPAPRMTRSDKWRNPRRPCVQRYFDYRDVVRKSVGDLKQVPDHITAVFHLPMPESWPKKKRHAMLGKPHKQKPDLDNLDKGLKDALFAEDGAIWSGQQRKLWCYSGQERIELTLEFKP